MDRTMNREPHNNNSGLVRDIIIGMSDGLTVFPHEGFNDAHVGKVFLDGAVDAIHFLLHPDEERYAFSEDEIDADG
jgi:hypothetical protein